MKIIPVIDYQRGNVVLAQKGNRNKYRAISSVLCAESDLISVIDGILTLAAFKTIYIADLDSIENHHPDNESLWSQLCSHYPDIEFWIDLGNGAESWQRLMNNTINARPVIGTESYSDSNQLAHILNVISAFNPLLSVDIKDDMILGPSNLLREFNAWPDEVIILSLSQVGSNDGPDINSIQSIRKYLSSSTLHYGGGIRDTDDIKLLDSLGIHGVMLANSLHTGSLSKDHLEKFTL